MATAELFAVDLMRSTRALHGSLERSLEYVRATLAPREARSNAMPSPIPREAPVTIALRLLSTRTPHAWELAHTLCLRAFVVACCLPFSSNVGVLWRPLVMVEQMSSSCSLN